MTQGKGTQKLTDEQYRAATASGLRQLVVASAGSGKTATMVARAVHALATGRVRADQILLLAFNRAAAHELETRLQAWMSTADFTGQRPRVSTLHAFALDVTKRSSPVSLEVIEDILPQVLRLLPEQSVDLIENWLFFQVFDGVEIRHPGDFSSGRAWRRFVARQRGAGSGQQGFLTLRHESVETPLEQAVANWLYLHRIDYEYLYSSRVGAWWQRVCPWGYRPLSGQRVFVLPATGQKVVCLTEEAAKRRCWQTFVVVTLADFTAGRLFDCLRQQCCPQRQQLPTSHVTRLLKSAGLQPGRQQVVMLQQCVGLARLRQWEGGSSGSGLIMPGTQAIYDRYTMALLTSLVAACRKYQKNHAVIDYHGMLEQAAASLRTGRVRYGYRLVLMDEFQDTSRAGMALLCSLLSQDPDCAFFAVGDDWQSIYGFAGAQPNVFQEFEQAFGPTEVFHLTRTFRFDQYLADTAGKFIQRNPAQWPKTVRALRAGSQDTLQWQRYTSVSHMQVVCLEILQKLAEAASGHPQDILLLGRYRHQRPADLTAWQQAFPQLRLAYQTVHAAKGGEADVVILLGLEYGRHGFPPSPDDNALLSLVRAKADDFPFAEERRLFYVALTRARHGVYLLVHKTQPSPFVMELGLSPTMEQAISPTIP